jgi:hypothetical protein
MNKSGWLYVVTMAYNAVVVLATFLLFYYTRSPWSFLLLLAGSTGAHIKDTQ